MQSCVSFEKYYSQTVAIQIIEIVIDAGVKPFTQRYSILPGGSYFCSMPCYKIHISGAVYKTGFRYYLKAKADFSGITGVVFYEDDKSVGVIASGSEENINKFLKFSKTSFYPDQIENTKIMEIPFREFSSFEVVDEKPEAPDVIQE